MALCLSRMRGETLVIGEIEITVVRASGGKCKLRITAPQDVRIIRKELLNQDDKTQRRDSQGRAE